jgi:hypothetical protein
MLFPFQPNLRAALYVVTRSYKTDVIPHRDGSEQRIALRQTARKEIEYRSAFKLPCVRDLDLELDTAQRTNVRIPERTRFVRLTTGVGSGGTVLPVDSVPAWIDEGFELVLMSGSVQELVVVESIAANNITLADPVVNNYVTGVRVHPALRGYLRPELSTELYTRNRQRSPLSISVRFDVDPGLEALENLGVAAAEFEGLEVFLTKPNHWIPIDITREQFRESIDYGYGRTQMFHPVQHGVRIWQGTYTGCNPAADDSLRAFFDRMRGQQGEFWMPTFQPDMVPTVQANLGTSELEVNGSDVAETYVDSPTHQVIAVKVGSTWYYNRVTNIVDNFGTSTLAVETAWPVNIPITAQVCWLLLWRLGSDNMTTEYVGGVLDNEPVGRTRLSFRSLPVLTEVGT